MKLGTVMIFVRALPRMREFYERDLGLEAVPEARSRAGSSSTPAWLDWGFIRFPSTCSPNWGPKTPRPARISR